MNFHLFWVALSCLMIYLCEIDSLRILDIIVAHQKVQTCVPWLMALGNMILALFLWLRYVNSFQELFIFLSILQKIIVLTSQLFSDFSGSYFSWSYTINLYERQPHSCWFEKFSGSHSCGELINFSNFLPLPDKTCLPYSKLSCVMLARCTSWQF